MRNTLLLVVVFFFSNTSFSQKEFFRSQQSYTTDQLNNFYSSFTIEGDRVVFIANDYNIYSYNRHTGKQQWKTSASYKSNVAPFITGSVVYAGVHENRVTSAAQFDLNTGTLLKLLPVGALATKPVMKDSILFGTALYEAGCLFAYDTKQDTIVWWRFLAHGFSEQPYYFPGFIQANAEADNWVKLNYAGVLLDTSCKTKADIFVRDIPCVKNFLALTHDGLEIKSDFLTKHFGDNDITTSDVITSDRHSFILVNDRLAIITNKRKLKKLVELAELLPDTAVNTYSLFNKLLGANDETVSFAYSNYLILYNHRKERVDNIIDLTPWEPHQVLLDSNRLWLISKKDGLLYGLSL